MKRNAWEILGLLVVVGITVVTITLLPATELPEPRKINDWDKQALSMLGEMNKLLISLSTLLLGALGALVYHEGAVRLHGRVLRYLIVLSFYCACFSLYWGFVVYSRGLEMLEARVFNSADPGLQAPQIAQYYSFLLALVIFLVSIVLISRRGGVSGTVDGT